MLTHEQVSMPNGVKVDVGMANLLGALWALGIRTSYSCQGTPDESAVELWTCDAGYIQFPDATDALAFFAKTLGPITDPERWVQIVIEVRHPSAPGEPFVRRSPSVTLELTKDHHGDEGSLRGCVRFDPKLLPVVEAVFDADHT